jgi:hypothetical protein
VSWQPFGPQHVERVALLLQERLRNAPLPPPDVQETEFGFTSRALQPLIAEAVHDREITGLLHAGDGVAPVAPVSFLGKPFYPDITVAFHTQLLLACEVKFLKDRQRQNVLATALGQASLYRAAGYERAMLVLLDVGRPSLRPDQVQMADALLHSAHGLHLVVRTLGRGCFEPHPAEAS